MMKIDLNQELWKYVEVSTQDISEWRAQHLRKFNVKRGLEKVAEWMAAAGQLKQHLPVADPVLAHWYKFLQVLIGALPGIFSFFQILHHD